MPPGVRKPHSCLVVTLKAIALGTGVVSFFIGAAVTFAAIRLIGKGSPELAFVVGAILGTQLATVAHHRQPQATASAGTKLGLGVALGAAALIFGLLAHVAFRPYTYPDVSIPMAVVGSFVFPFVLFDTMWKALSKHR